MALYGGLAENTRRNERVERGVVTVPGANGIATVGFTSTQTVNLSANPGALGGMRQMTHFTLTIDDAGTRLTASNSLGVIVSGSLNAAGTILTVNVYAIGATGLVATPTDGATKVRFTVYGNLSGGQGF